MNKQTLEALRLLVKNWWKVGILCAVIVAIAGLALSGYKLNVGPLACDKQAIDIKKTDIKHE